MGLWTAILEGVTAGRSWDLCSQSASRPGWQPCATASGKAPVLAELVCFLICEVVPPALLTTQHV